jgi:hypothetical protein
MPNDAPRNLDFMPVLSILTDPRMNPKQEVYHYVGEVSTKIGVTMRTEKQTELGGKVIFISPNRQTAWVEYGHPNPKLSGLRLTLKEIFEDTTKVHGVPDVVGKEQGLVITRSDVLDKFPILQDSSTIFMKQTACSNLVIKTRRMLGAYWLENPRLIIREQLLTSGIIKTPRDDRIRYRTRSTFKTDWLITDRKGWSDLLPLMLPLQREVREWWQDTGIPQKLILTPDHREVTIFRLDKQPTAMIAV